MRESPLGFRKEGNVTSFEWHVNSIRALKEEVEKPKDIWTVEEDEPESHEVFKRGIVTSEGWYKFDICEYYTPGFAFLNDASPKSAPTWHTVIRRVW